MKNNSIPILLPLFQLAIEGSLALDPLNYGGEITNEMKKTASLFDGNRKGIPILSVILNFNDNYVYLMEKKH